MKNRAGGGFLFSVFFVFFTRSPSPISSVTFLHLEFVLVLGILHCVSIFVRKMILKNKMDFRNHSVHISQLFCYANQYFDL